MSRADWISRAVRELPALVTIEEACRFLRCSDRQLRRLIACGELRGLRNVKAGSSRVRIPSDSIATYLRRMGGHVR